MKKKIAGGTKEDAFVVSDSCSDELKGITDSSDDDGVEPISSRCVFKRKSRAKPLKNRVYYDENKKNAHEQLEMDMCFLHLRQVRKALEEYHIACSRKFTYLKNNQDSVIVCCSYY